MGYSVPEVESAPVFSIKLIHRSDQLSTGRGWGSALPASNQHPPLLNCVAVRCILPNKKYLLKSKLHCAPDLRFYYCDVVHIVKTRNALNFLPYI
jgi:hypothetical protein